MIVLNPQIAVRDATCMGLVRRSHNWPADTLKKYKLTLYGKMTAPVFTRWWTVRAGCSFIFDCYLVIFHAAQTVINLHASGLMPHSIASDLFSLMLSQDNFVDLCLIQSFHKACLNKHLDWLQSADDLTEMQAFQSHNIVGRCCIVPKDLQHFLSGCSLPDYHKAVKRVSDVADNKRNKEKLFIFIKHAHESLHKHDGKWLSPKLHPAALLSEGPMANVVAACVLNKTSTHGIPGD